MIPVASMEHMVTHNGGNNKHLYHLQPRHDVFARPCETFEASRPHNGRCVGLSRHSDCNGQFANHLSGSRSESVSCLCTIYPLVIAMMSTMVSRTTQLMVGRAVDALFSMYSGYNKSFGNFGKSGGAVGTKSSKLSPGRCMKVTAAKTGNSCVAVVLSLPNLQVEVE